MTDTEPDKKSQSRRKILRSLVAGGGAVTSSKMLPDAWTKPVVEAVLIPAHAQTSGPARIQGVFRTGRSMMMNTDLGDSEQLFASAKENDDGATDSVLDFFISPASANEVDNCSRVFRMVEEISFNILDNNPTVMARLALPDGQEICSMGTITGSSISDISFGWDWLCTNNVATEGNVSGMIQYIPSNSTCVMGYSADKDNMPYVDCD